MSARRRLERKTNDNRPVVTDDFIYDDPSSTGSDSGSVSETPDEAVRKLRGRSTRARDKAPKEDSSAAGSPDDEVSDGHETVYSSGIMLDENLQPVIMPGKKHRRPHPVLRGIILTAVTLVLLLSVAAYIFHQMSPQTSGLDLPENVISSAVTPVQNFFSGLTESIFGYFRSIKLRQNLETAYNELRAENEQLVYKAMLADELQNTLSQYEDLSSEISANAAMRPIICTVIGKSDSNYFSTMTINKGTEDGVENYMAVTISGALVGYTENARAHECTVRTIIDSDASIAALIQSSRDQGTVRGTLGEDGTPACRMYYLPDDNLPRPGDLVITSGVGMSFPKGIPIGVVRESTRGMDKNKQYIVLDPIVDFQHLEYVIVLRYSPTAEAIQGRENGRTDIELVPLESARPSPIVPEIAASLFESQELDTSELSDAPAPSEVPTETPSPTPTPTATPEPSPAPAAEESPLTYQVVSFSDEPTPTPVPTSAPTFTPYFTPDPDDMTFEED